MNFTESIKSHIHLQFKKKCQEINPTRITFKNQSDWSLSPKKAIPCCVEGPAKD